MGEATPRAEVREAIERLLEHDQLELPPLPQVATQVMDLSRSADAKPEDLVALIERDVGLASHVLRVSNSAALGGRVRILTLGDAVMRLGMQRVAEVCLTLSLRSKDFAAPRFTALFQGLWRHAFATGLLAKDLAEERRERSDKAFLCGLLHDVGKPLVVRTLDRMVAASELAVEEIEVSQMAEAFRAQVGTAAAEKWELPRTVKAVIEHGQDYDAAKTFRNQAMVTWAADRLALHFLDPERLPVESLREDPVFPALGMDDLAIDEVLGSRARVVNQVESALG